MFKTFQISRNVSQRYMSGGVKGIRYKVEQLNKDLPRDGTSNTKYGIPYRVVSKRSIYSNTPKFNNNINSHVATKLDLKRVNVFDMLFKQNIIVSGKDSKAFLDTVVTNDIRITEVGQTRKSLVLNNLGKILGMGIINRYEHYYSLLMETDTIKKNNLIEHLFDNKGNFDVSISRNTLDSVFLISGDGSSEIVENINNVLGSSKMNGSTLIKDLPFQRNLMFTNQLVPNNTFTVINTPLGYYVSINKQVKNNLFKNLDIETANHDLYETHRIQSGIPDYIKDLGKLYNPLEANLHSHFGKNYEYSKRRPIGTDFIGKDALFTKTGVFRKFNKTRVMLYSCGKGLIPPEGSNIYIDSKKVGTVTSSTSSSYLKCIIAMGYIDLQKTFDTNSFSLAREMVKKVAINGNEYVIRFI
jgi:glycine cleavage system aminomethyltransferase T